MSRTLRWQRIIERHRAQAGIARGVSRRAIAMKKFLAGVALTALLGGSAMAADMAVKARPYAPPVPMWSWSGFYLGINGGYSAGRDEFNQTLVALPGAGG